MADQLPKIEIRGLAVDVTSFRNGVKDMRAMMAKLQETRSGLYQDLADVNQQLSQLRNDIRFELTTLGNSGGNSDAQSESGANPAPLTAGSIASIEPGKQ
jgi:hypothetical protein